MTSLRLFFLIFFVGAVFVAPVYVAQASEPAWVSSEYMQARLIAARDESGTQEDVKAALQIRLAPGWHSYWRTPGDAGLPPRLNWEGSQNLKGAEILWPAPKRFSEHGLQAFGYEGSVTFPLVLDLVQPEDKTALALKLELLLCSDICVPQSLNLALDVPEGDEGAGLLSLIKHAARKIPAQEGTPSLKIENVVAGPEALVVTAFSQEGFGRSDLIVEILSEEPGGAFALTAPPEVIADDKDKRKAMLKIAKPSDAGNMTEFLAGKEVRLTLISGSKAVETQVKF